MIGRRVWTVRVVRVLLGTLMAARAEAMTSQGYIHWHDGCGNWTTDQWNFRVVATVSGDAVPGDYFVHCPWGGDVDVRVYSDHSFAYVGGNNNPGGYWQASQNSSTRTFTVTQPSGGNATLPDATVSLVRVDSACGDNSAGHVITLSIPIQIGSSECKEAVTVTAHWQGGAPHAASVVVNAVVGGYLAQIQCEADGCNSGTIPAAMLNLTGSSPWSVDAGVDTRSWAICGVEGSRYQTKVTIASGPSTVACGGTVDIGISANCVQPTPTPSPSASIAPSPSTTPVITPAPTPSATPLQYPTPPPNNPGPTVTNGGTTGSGISNQDIYNDVKQALDDAGTRDSHFGAPNGSFGFGTGPGGENGTAGNDLQSAVDRFTNDLSGAHDGLMGYVDSIDSLDLPTGIGEKKTWNATLPVLGDIVIDATPYDGPVWAFRSLCLAILIVCAWFAMIRIIRSGVA